MSTHLETQTFAAEQEWLSLWRSGPTRLRWDAAPLQVGDKAPDFELQDATGAAHRLADFWRDAPALLLFWRHHGCSCGVTRARRLKDEFAAYRALGVKVVVIGQGQPESAADYARRHQLPCSVLCDPMRIAYRAYDLLDGKPSQIVFDAPEEFLRVDLEAGAGLQQARRGTERAAVNSPWQLPGEFVVDRSGTVQLAYRYQHCEDWPNPLVLVAALKEALWACA